MVFIFLLSRKVVLVAFYAGQAALEKFESEFGHSGVVLGERKAMSRGIWDVEGLQRLEGLLLSWLPQVRLPLDL
jgi:hypothetical protein